ncbi:MAG TPA: hypothetical protein VKV79_06015, partial [Terriglobia bacterium]|nr:hypothetical protein [Terriglobia bacterium]
LSWKKARVDRAQQALCERQLEALELERQRRASAMGRESANASQAAVLESGLRGLKDSPAKFGEMNRVLEMLLNKAKNREYTDDISPAITLLYGKDPTLRGAQITALYQELREKTQKGETAPLGMLPDQLHLVVLEEISDLTEQSHIYWQDNVCISRAQRQAAVAPRGPEWSLLIRMENSLHRHIERKMRLLDRLQRTRQGLAKSAGETGAGEAEDDMQ